jgi:diadenosine tetraphosphatase ApaH/serine/threonine PP2A family protein phosphatase
VCNEAIPLLLREPSLLEVQTQGETIIVGDLHSNFGAYLEALRIFFEKRRDGAKIVFLGDYADRGTHAPGGIQGVRVVTALLKLKTMFPNDVYLIRGNHEDINANYQYGLLDECRRMYPAGGQRFSNTVHTRINDVFNCLSYAVVVNNSTFCAHGGISPRIMGNLQSIEVVQKPLLINTLDIQENTATAIDLLWSDPENSVAEFRENPRGSGQIFGRGQVAGFLQNNGLTRIVRAHQTVQNGYLDVFGNGSIITVFSAYDYNSEGGETQGQ